MKKTSTSSFIYGLFILGFMLFTSVGSFAQITLTLADMPRPGIMIIHDVDTTSQWTPGSAGMNQTWDFSTAGSMYIDSIGYYNPATLPGGAMFPGANLAEGRILIDSIGVLTSYAFYNQTNDGVFAHGMTVEMQIPGYSYVGTQNYDPIPEILPFPLTYGTQNSASTTGYFYTSVWIGEMQLDSSLTVSLISASQEVDGYGTLITPAGSYDALRLIETSTTIDSTFNFDGEWTLISVDTTEFTSYRWFTNVLGEVASLNLEDDESMQLRYFKEVVVSVPKLQADPDLILYPNPATDRIKLQTTKDIDKVEVYNYNGQWMLTELSTTIIDINHLTPGMYFCKIYTDDGISVHKFTKTK